MSASSQPFDRYSPDRVRLWLQERLENAQRLAKQKTGDDRLGWLDDANYYEAALKLLPALEDK